MGMQPRPIFLNLVNRCGVSIHDRRLHAWSSSLFAFVRQRRMFRRVGKVHHCSCVCRGGDRVASSHAWRDVETLSPCRDLELWLCLISRAQCVRASRQLFKAEVRERSFISGRWGEPSASTGDRGVRTIFEPRKAAVIARAWLWLACCVRVLWYSRAVR